MKVIPKHSKHKGTDWSKKLHDEVVDMFRRVPFSTDIDKCSVVIGALNGNNGPHFPPAEAVLICEPIEGEMYALDKGYKRLIGMRDGHYSTPIMLDESDKQLSVGEFVRSVGIAYAAGGVMHAREMNAAEREAKVAKQSPIKRMLSAIGDGAKQGDEEPVDACLASAYEKVFADPKKEGKQILTSREVIMLASEITRLYEHSLRKKNHTKTADEEKQEQPKKAQGRFNFAEMEFDELTDFVQAYIRKMAMDGTIGDLENVDRMTRLINIGQKGLQTALNAHDEEEKKKQTALKSVRKLASGKEDKNIN